jgi:hypothetical protein
LGLEISLGGTGWVNAVFATSHFFSERLFLGFKKPSVLSIGWKLLAVTHCFSKEQLKHQRPMRKDVHIPGMGWNHRRWLLNRENGWILPKKYGHLPSEKVEYIS